MLRRLGTAALLASLVLGGLLTTGAAAAGPALPLPASMAAVGDSISQAASSAGSLGADAPQNSWSTGTSSSVNSHYLRLLAAGAPISGANHNLSVSGAKAANLAAQMQNVVAIQPDYLTVEIGGNDVCTDTVGQMTAVADFRAQIESAMAILAAGSPGTHVFMASIPDAYQLWALFKDDFWARFIWSVGGICQSLLANPTSTQATDVQRRLAVRQRNIDFNTQLAAVCAAYASTCLWDGNAVFDTRFAKSDVAGDYFHPSVAGQAKLAAGTWAVGYTWTATPPPPATPMWVGGMSSTTTSGRTWTATVTVAVTDGSQPVPGVLVTGTWSAGSGATTCTTTASGTCSVTSSSLNKKTASVRFTVSSLAREGWVYTSGSNVVSSLLVNKP
ncbi:MAG TPA: GDSL-type esterase/lipase family protein [Candidatus Limnocylindrales bacterium]|nr:GDSL-type esterase/lipase family protein [Candidatus Limnocylindrales bacterium]